MEYGLPWKSLTFGETKLVNRLGRSGKVVPEFAMPIFKVLSIV